MKVYLSNPNHSYYSEIRDSPPKKVHYITQERSFRSILKVNRKQITFYLNHKLRDNVNTHIVLSKTNHDVIHSNGALITSANKNWLVDFESGAALNRFEPPTESEIEYINEYLGSNRCKYLLPWSKAAKQGFETLFGGKFQHKTEILYPAVETRENPNTDIPDSKTRLCFVAKDFEKKGGKELIATFKQLKETNEDIILEIASASGKEFADIEGVKHHGLISREKVFEMMSRSDIFVYPTLRDTLGMVILEAMAHKLPIVTLDEYAIPEIVKDGETGYVCKGYDKKWYDKNYVPKDNYSWPEQLKKIREEDLEKVVERLKEKVEELVDSEEKRVEMGEKGYERVGSGKFSIKERNKKLKQIYNTAI